jgi:hypothetical protein
VRVGDDLPLVPGRGEQAPRPSIDAERLGPAKLHAAPDRRADRQLGHGGRHLVNGDWLRQPRREPDAVALGTGLDDLGEELEELRGAQDGARDRPGLDLGLLGDLGPHVATIGQAVGSDDRHREVVTDPGGALGGQQVARRRGEELPHRIVLPDRRVGDVDEDVGARHHVGKALAGDRVDARGGRGRHRIVTVRGQPADDVPAEASGPPDDHDLHDLPSCR